jgi:type VI secretion system secreted protein VgrG
MEPVTIHGPASLPSDTLTFQSLVGSESLGRCFEYAIEVLSAKADLTPADTFRQGVTVQLTLPNGGSRFYNGLIAGVEYRGWTSDGARYRLLVRPWLWFLGKSANCRIFQNKTVVDIIRKVFDDHQFSDYADFSGLQESYDAREFVVQYRETDLNFVTRLMEAEGIYYFFRQGDGQHTLVLVDSPSAHEPVAGYENIPFRPQDTQRASVMEYVSSWNVVHESQPGTYSQADFDFTKPKVRLYSTHVGAQDCGLDKFEVYEYPGGFLTNHVGDAYSAIRLEELQVRFAETFGATNARGVAVGSTFKLTDHPRDDLNAEYLVTSVDLNLRAPAVRSGVGDEGDHVFACSFAAIDPAAPFRAVPTAIKPTVRGPQTAVVVGPGGEEIWTDQYGRVKVQFHWDRDGASNENSSCWIRVSQVWAGSNWGAIHIPRIGQEVIVDFLEGDPDRPIVVGRVYNGANMPPYALPANQTQSGIKSRSTKGGVMTNANEIRFEDRMGSEEFFAQAEKDLNAVIKNNESVSVGASRTVSVGTDDALTVGSNRTVKIKANHDVSVTGNETVSVQGNESMSIQGNETTTVVGNDTKTVSGSQTLSVSGSRTETVTGAETIVVVAGQSVTALSQTTTVGSRTATVAGGDSLSVGGSRSTSVGGDMTISVAGKRSLSVDGDESVTVGGNESISVTGDQTISITGAGTIKVGKAMSIDVADEITIKSGDATVTLKKGGDVVIKGGKISVEASSDLVLKGSKISLN